MSNPTSPKLNKAGLVLINPDSGLVERNIALQYNPDTLSRSFAVQDTAPSSGGDKSQALRVTGPAVETLSVEAVLDATDALAAGDKDAHELGIHRELAVIESILQPTTATLRSNDQLADRGSLEVLPMESLLSVFVWGPQRVVPVRLTALSITEEAFSPELNPLRATLGLTMRILSVDDLGFSHKGGNLFLAYLQNKEVLRDRANHVDIGVFGIGGAL